MFMIAVKTLSYLHPKKNKNNNQRSFKTLSNTLESKKLTIK
jgi:hypothetical protein